MSNDVYDDYAGVEEDVNGKAILILDGMPDFFENRDFDDIDLLFEKIKNAQALKAGALIVCSVPNSSDKYAPYLAYRSSIPEALSVKVNCKKKHGSFSSIDMELAGAISKNRKPEFKIEIPVFFISNCNAKLKEIENLSKLNIIKEQINNTKTPHSKTLKDLKLVINLEYGKREIVTNNIIGLLENSKSEQRDEAIVFGAHYDHLGKDENGNIFFGADDNASGVAVLLEVSSILGKLKNQLERSVIFVAFGAEEWGLQGSQHFVENIELMGKKIVSMINIDSIGKGEASKVWFVGESFYPKLASLPNKYLNEFGLTKGDNIDRHAFRYGSDHYPFHLKNIPAIDIFATNYRELHKITDTWQLINAEKVTNIGKVLCLALFDLLLK